MENKCENPSCVFKKHTDINNNGGTHCCATCKKTNGNHGHLCSKTNYNVNTPNQKKLLLSYQRSGNHLTRFFIELLSEQPTIGWRCVSDTPIYLNSFPEEIPFNIKNLNEYNVEYLYKKEHFVPETNGYNKFIFLLRNPKEVLLRHNNYKIDMKSYNMYFKLIDYYKKSTADKIIFFYEDILSDKRKFITDLYNFLELKNPAKLAYALENIDHLYKLSELGKGRAWGGVRSNGEISYYYKKIPENIKKEFDTYLEKKLKTNNYNIIKKKYGL